MPSPPERHPATTTAEPAEVPTDRIVPAPTSHPPSRRARREEIERFRLAARAQANCFGVTAGDVAVAARRIAGQVARTEVVRCPELDRRAGSTVHLKSENLQASGAFKLRGATNAVLSLDQGAAARGVACHSSGNHGAALAQAAQRRGIPVTVVMPEGSSPTKVAAVAAAGARIVWCAPVLAAREATLAEVLTETGAVEVHPYDDPRVIAGQGTAAMELLEDVPGIDTILVPVGGGGLCSGTLLAAAAHRDGIDVWGAEPAGADDAARSLAAGFRLTDGVSDTIADGLRTTLSERTFAIINSGVSGIVTVPDDATVAAQAFLREHAGLLVEPSAAVAVAALLAAPISGREIGVILTGGNVDPGGG